MSFVTQPFFTRTYINVKDAPYSAVGDGVTDDTNAIQNAINAAANNSLTGSNITGGIVIFPWTPGNTYLVRGLTLYNNVGLLGIGPTTIKLANGANADVIQGYNALALMGSTNTGGIYGWSIANLIIDGNKANQTGTSYGIRQYGYGFKLQNLVIRNTYSDGIWSDWNGGSTSSNDSMESVVSNCKIHDTGGMGVNWTGPHDSQFINVVSYRTGTHAYYVGPNAGGMQFTQCHAWGMSAGVRAVAWLIESQTTLVNCQAEGSDTVQVAILANNCIWSGGRIFSGGSGSYNTSGLQIGQASGGSPFPGSFFQNGGVTTGASAKGYFIDTVISTCEGPNGSIIFANDSGRGFIRANVVLQAGDGNSNLVSSGTPNASTQLWVVPGGAVPTTDGTMATGGRVKFAADALNAFVVGNGTQDIFNINTHLARTEFPNGNFIRGYSDNYITTSFQLDTTLSTTQSASAAAIATGGTATTSGVGVCRLAPTAAVTGCILQSGTRAGQQVWVVNESANNVSWATQATSHIAGEAGGTFVLGGGKAQLFVWDSSTSLWYKAS